MPAMMSTYIRYSNGLPRRGRDSSLCRLNPRSANGCSAPSSEPGSSSTAHTSEVLSGGPRPGSSWPRIANFVKFSFSVWIRSASTARPKFFAASTLAIAASSRSPERAICRAAPAVSCTGTGSIRIDARNSSHCASACQWERARRISSSRAPGTPIRAWSTRTTTSPTMWSNVVCCNRS